MFVDKIQSENVVVIMLEDIELRDVEGEIERISDEVGIDIRAIKYFMVPDESKDTETEGKQADLDSQVLVFAYAYGSDLLVAEEIVEAISDEVEIAIETYEGYAATVHKSSDCNLTGLIVAVSLLGSLLLLIVIGTPLLWFLWLRFKIKGYSRKSSDASAKTIEREINIEENPTSVETETNDNQSPASTQSDADIMGIQIDGTTEGKGNKFPNKLF